MTIKTTELNASLLSAILDQAKQRGNEALCHEIKRLSPVAWQHYAAQIVCLVEKSRIHVSYT